MGRARDIANVLSSSTNIALDSELGLSLITPTSVTTTGGSATVSSTGTVSFTSASAISLNDVFSSNYTNYRLLITHSQGDANYLGFRLRVSGSDASGSNYSRQFTRGINTAIQANADNNTTFHVIGSGATSVASINADIFRPFETERTKIISMGFYTGFVVTMGGDHSLSTSYTGFTLFPETGTMTGTISVYGYRK
jgi:hypothetical protein